MKQVFGWAFPEADEFMAKELNADGTYQGSHVTAVLEHVTDRSVAVDGGAHIGSWSRLFSAQFARVIAVEPSADTFEALEVNMRRFGCANVEMKPVALGASRGWVSMVLDGRGAELQNTGARHVGSGAAIPCEAIDDWHLPSLGLLKLDVEGSEVGALTGAALTIQRCKPIVLFEDKGLWKRHYGLPRDAPQQVLTSLGYQHLQRVGCDEIWGPVS